MLGLGILYSDSQIPPLYRFKSESSKEIGRTVFFNDLGGLIIEYYKESFVKVFEKEGKPKVDFFSKNKSKATDMKQEKATAYEMKCMK